MPNPNICHQKLIRDANLERDLSAFNLTLEEASKLKIKDFKFRLAETPADKKQIDDYIIENEWLGTVGMRSKWKFGAYYKGKLCGALIFTLPAAYSNSVGEHTKRIEILLARGACSSFTPIGLASCFISWAIKYFVNNTDFRVFMGYSDTYAGEIGTIYQALNWYYLGQKFGTRFTLVDKRTGKPVSDRLFKIREAYRRYAKQAGIIWQKEWNNEADTGLNWPAVPPDIAETLRRMSREDRANSEKIYTDPKHKYMYVLGRTKKETKELRKEFLKRNKVLPYPKRTKTS